MDGQEIIERLARIEERVDRLLEIGIRHDRLLAGNGTAGLVTRLDRIEQIEARRRWTIRTIVVALLGVVGSMIAEGLRLFR